MTHIGLTLLLAAVRVLLGVVVVRLVLGLVGRRLYRISVETRTETDNILIRGLLSTAGPIGYLVALQWGWNFLVANLASLQGGGWGDRFMRGAFLLIAIVLLVRWINRSLVVLLDHSLRRLGHEKQLNMLQALSPMISSLIWILGALIFLQNQGLELSAIYASLAGAGIGIGLALRGPIANFLDYLTIIIDEPIQIGQTIGFADVLGAVEVVGIRSTAIRSVSGEKVLVSNGNLLNQTIRNFGDLRRRRLTQLIRVVQQTPVEKAAAIPSMVKQVIGAHGPAQFERCHFIRFIDGALEFEFNFFVPKDDFNLALDLQQAINLDIMRQFAENEIELA